MSSNFFKLKKNNLTKSKHTRQRYDRPGHMQNVEKQRNSRNIECRIEFHHLQHHGRSGARGMQITRPHRAAHWQSTKQVSFKNNLKNELNFFSFGEKTEHLFCDSIAEGSDMLQKLSYSWRCPGPRQRSQVLLMTNQDQARIRRNQAKQWKYQCKSTTQYFSRFNLGSN